MEQSNITTASNTEAPAISLEVMKQYIDTMRHAPVQIKEIRYNCSKEHFLEVFDIKEAKDPSTPNAVAALYGTPVIKDEGLAENEVRVLDEKDNVLNTFTI